MYQNTLCVPKLLTFNIWLYAGSFGETTTECGIITVYSSLRRLKVLQSTTV